MKPYLLLRDNQESGPYSLGELEQMGLRPMDLVWIEGRSTSWSYPTEILRLEPLVRAASTETRTQPAPAHIFVSLPSNGHARPRPSYARMNAEREPAVTNDVLPFPELKERIPSAAPKAIWNKPLIRFSGLMNVVVVFVAMIGCAFLIKKMVDGYDGNTQAPVETAIAAPVQEAAAPMAAQTALPPVQDAPLATPAVEKLPPKAVRPKDIRKQIALRTNTYHVGLFGGINGLQLTVSNTSPLFIDRVVVLVNYLKPNGEVVESQQYEVAGIRPNGSKTLSVPASARGVKVQYRLVGVYSQQYKAALKQA